MYICGDASVKPAASFTSLLPTFFVLNLLNTLVQILSSLRPVISPTMKATRVSVSVLLGALSAVCVHAAPVVDTTYPYTGPAVPIGDWVDPTVNGNGKGFPRLVEPPAVKPAKSNPTNNINVISLSYVPQGVNIHYQTPFGLGVAPSVRWGNSPSNLNRQASGISQTYVTITKCGGLITR